MRQRVITATIRLVGTTGYEATNVEEIAAEAGIDVESLREEFNDKEGCFLAAWDDIAVEYAQVVGEAYNSKEEWRDRLRAMAYASVGYLQGNPLRTRVGVIEALYAGDAAQARRDLFLQSQVELIHAGRYELDDPDSVPRSVAETTVGAIWDTIVKGVRSGDLSRSVDLAPQLMYLAVLPYLGPDIAVQELNH